MIVALFLIKAAVALNMIVFGIDQFVHPEKWLNYLPKWIKAVYGVQPESIIRAHSVGNLILGVLLVSGLFPLLATWFVFIWWVALLPFSFMDNWKNGMRDLTVSTCILAAIYLTS